MGFEPTTPTLARLCSTFRPGSVGARRQVTLQGGVNCNLLRRHVVGSRSCEPGAALFNDAEDGWCDLLHTELC